MNEEQVTYYMINPNGRFRLNQTTEEEAIDYALTQMEKRNLIFATVVKQTREEIWSIDGRGEDEHLGCYSYPNCDLAPNGCIRVMGKDVEPYGHRD